MARINPGAETSPEQLFDTEIPDFSDNANIQEALRMYHYGTSDGSYVDTNAEITNGVAGYLKIAFDNIAAIQDVGIGSSYQSSAPTSVTAGHIWMDSSSSGVQSFITRSAYQAAAPTDGLFDGYIWIEKGSTPLKMYVYDADSSTWKEIGA